MIDKHSHAEWLTFGTQQALAGFYERALLFKANNLINREGKTTASKIVDAKTCEIISSLKNLAYVH